MLIYKIFRDFELKILKKFGESNGSTADQQDGFIHFCTAEQLEETQRKHFSNESNLFLVSFNSEKLDSALKWERSRNDQIFPHLYQKILYSDIVKVSSIDV